MADYKQNIGAYQSDYENDSKWNQNIGASQTDPLRFEDVDKVITAEGSITLDGVTIKVKPTGLNLTAEGTLDLAGYQVNNAFHIGHIMGDFIRPIQPGWDSGCDQGSVDAWPQGNPLPTLMDSPTGEGDADTGTYVAQAERDYTGSGQVNAHEAMWYEMAHLLPRVVQELGNLVSEQVINCDFYNADRNNKITVTSITNNLGTGIEVGGVPATPFDVESQDSLLFTLTIKTVGDLTINASYTLTTSTGESYTIYLTGSRIVMFPYRPESPLREHLIFDTKIIESVSGKEQRFANRKYPRSMFEATYKEGQQFIEMLLFDRQAKVVAFPAWHEPAFLTSTAAINDTTINVNTTSYGNFYVGGYAVVIEDETTYDALKIKSITATTLEFESGMTYNYTKKAQVLPLLTSYIEAASASLKRPYNHQYFNLRIHVDPEINDIASNAAFGTYNSQTFLDDPNMIEGGQLAESIRTKIFVLDNMTGLRSQVTAWDHSKRHSKKGWKCNNRQELWELRQLLHYLKGRQVGFYIPTFWKDLTLTGNLQIGTLTMNIEMIGYTVNAQQRWPKQVIRVHLKNGTILTRTIQNSSIVDKDNEQLTVDTAWATTYTPAEIERIEFLEKVRLDVDDIVITHYNALGQAECVVPLKEVENS